VQLGDLAQQKGNSQAVRDFGKRMVADHGKANDQLKQIASKKGVSIPPSLSHSEQSMLEQLQNASGATFDKDYAKGMVKDHRQDIKQFQKAAKELTDPDLRAWAEQTLPILQQHLGMAEQMEANVKSER
jgi:putative membrane protein